MRKLIAQLKQLQQTEVKNIIEERISEFESFKERSNEDIFRELCFCLTTANYDAQKAIWLHENLRDDVIKLSLEELQSRLKELGYRYPNVRAKFIVEARKHIPKLHQTIFGNGFCSEELREHIQKNVKGLGLKESSHFLRNIGFKDYAILDFHIIDILAQHNVIDKPNKKSLTPKQYLEIEREVQKLGEKAGLDMARLDYYLWYMETGKVLK